MGIYLNPGNEGFWEAVSSKVYVDKTGLIKYTNELMNTEQKHICVSRPRRFGKSMALKMLAAYCFFEEYTGFTEKEVKTLCKHYDMDFDGLRSDIIRMLGGGRVRVNTRSFQNDMRNFKVRDDVLTLLIHLGYLGYDMDAEEAFIPNKEISRNLKTP